MGLYDRDYMRADREPWKPNRQKTPRRFPIWFALVVVIVLIAFLLWSC